MIRLPGMILCSLFAAMALAGCAEKIEDANGKAYDPYEETNRDVYKFNTYLDVHALEPVAKVYRDDVPEPERVGVHNVLQNLNTPYIAVNDLAQGKFVAASADLARITLNSTIGLAGLLDVGKKAGLQPDSNGLGHTLAVYGIGHGPYLVLPLVGPSTPREAVGYIGDASGDPIDYFIPFGATVFEGGLGLVDQRSQYIEQVDDLRRNSVDEYAAVRSIYLQQLEASDRGEDSSGGTTADIPDYKDPATGTIQ